jgi:cell division transport system ATP-binding protein
MILESRSLTISQDEQKILDNINLQISAGEFVYLLGKTGSGKSSLLRCCYADLLPTSGDLEVCGFNIAAINVKEVPQLRRRLGIIFQDFELLTDRTVGENLKFVMDATGWTKRDNIPEGIDYLLSLVGMQEHHNQFPHQLSGGEQQRVAIARALVNNPDIILADEPTGSLDPLVARQILDLFWQINRMGTSLLMTTHQHNFLSYAPARVLLCENGRVKDIPAQEVRNRFGKKYPMLLLTFCELYTNEIMTEDRSNKIKITLIKDGETNQIWADTGENLRIALLANGYSPYTKYTRKINCGGRGICATCGLFFLKNSPEPKHWHDKLADRFGYPRLTCQINLSEDVTLLFPNKLIWGNPKK